MLQSSSEKVMTTEAFIQQVGKLFSELKDNLLFIYAEAEMERKIICQCFNWMFQLSSGKVMTTGAFSQKVSKFP